MYQVILSGGVKNLSTGQIIKRDMSSPAWQAYRTWLQAGNTPHEPEPVAPHVPTIEEIQADIVLKAQARMDDFVRTRGYDGMLSACTYATSSVPKFAVEGQYAVNSRDATWATLYAYMADVVAGLQPMPTGFEDVEPLLPVLVWPN